MAMVISPRSKIVTLALLIGIIVLAALIILGVVGVWHRNEKTSSNNAAAKVMSSKLQQITGYAAMQHVSKKKTKTINNATEQMQKDTAVPMLRAAILHVFDYTTRLIGVLKITHPNSYPMRD